MPLVGTKAILIGWGASRVQIVKGQVRRNKEDRLQVISMTGVLRNKSNNILKRHLRNRNKNMSQNLLCL